MSRNPETKLTQRGNHEQVGEVIALPGVDALMTPQMLTDIKTLRQVRDARALRF